MFSLYVECRQEEKDLLMADLWERGSRGITELDAAGDRCGLRAFFDDADAGKLERDFERYGATARTEEDCDWIEVARARLEPMLVGDRFFLVPEWRDDATPPDRLRIEVNPGLAFGTGAHESTQLCLERLEQELRPGMVVLDVGIGAGILAQAAELLGARQVFGCDIDPVAVEIASRKLSFVGSVDAVRTSSIDLITANISGEAMVQLAPDLLSAIRPGGIVIAGGIELSEAGDVERALHAAGASIRGSHAKGNWMALVAARS
jgi:ribosomal protein L11 methyltransferase